jgi:hypothetical protein
MLPESLFVVAATPREGAKFNNQGGPGAPIRQTVGCISLRTVRSCHEESSEQSKTLGDSRRVEQGVSIAEQVL